MKHRRHDGRSRLAGICAGLAIMAGALAPAMAGEPKNVNPQGLSSTDAPPPPRKSDEGKGGAVEAEPKPLPKKPAPTPATATKPKLAPPEKSEPVAKKNPGCTPIEDKNTLQKLVDKLKSGAHVIVFRHANKGEKRYHPGCLKPELSLTSRGVLSASAIGRKIDEKGLPTGLVRTSNYCRTVQTANLAFGRGTPSKALDPSDPAPEFLGAIVTYQLERLHGEKDTTNSVLVTHSNNVNKLVLGDVKPKSGGFAEGEAAVFARNTDGGIECLGRITANKILN